MRIEEKRIRTYLKLPPKEKLRHLLEYKLFVKKATLPREKKILIELKLRKENFYLDEPPPSMTSSE